jgi:RNA polymerase sigma-70 factor (ECF subfamily)
MAKNSNLLEIISGCKAGDTVSFELLIDEYSDRCYGYFYRLTGDRDQSNDLLSELFLKLVTKIGLYKGGSFESWLFRIATNIFHDHLRQKHRHSKALEARQDELSLRDAGSDKKGSDLINALQIQLAKLDADTRELIVMRYYSQLRFREIASIRGESIGTILSKVHRGIKKLRELMES